MTTIDDRCTDLREGGSRTFFNKAFLHLQANVAESGFLNNPTNLSVKREGSRSAYTAFLRVQAILITRPSERLDRNWITTPAISKTDQVQSMNF